MKVSSRVVISFLFNTEVLAVLPKSSPEKHCKYHKFSLFEFFLNFGFLFQLDLGKWPILIYCSRLKELGRKNVLANAVGRRR